MSEFNEFNWKIALADLYQRSLVDPAYRQLCQTDPIAAIQAVSDIELPPGVKMQFVEKRADFTYFFLLPPVSDPQSQSDETVKEIIQWSTICTDFTTTVTSPDL